MTLHTEGAITFETEGAFYNPKMMLNRDIGVAMSRALGLTEYLDAMSASGIRGLRVAREAGVEKVALNDVSPQAYELLVKNVARNDLACTVSCCNANILLHEQHFQAVDLDPFGSPSPYLPAASRSALNYLFITATDTAPLCGAHLKSGIRKYMTVPLRTDYHREMGARVLLGLAARELARLDKSLVPMLTHVTDHYVRTYLRVIKAQKQPTNAWNPWAMSSTAGVAAALSCSVIHIQKVNAFIVMPRLHWQGPCGSAGYKSRILSIWPSPVRA